MKIFITLALSFLSLSAHAEGIIKMNFVMAHKPDNEQNISLINEFSKNVSIRTNGKVVITPIMPEQIIDKEILKNYGPHKSTIQKLYVGEVEMGQVSAKTLTNYSNVIDVLDAPLVFSSHEHAAKVLDGNVGKKIRETVSTGSNGRLEGLAFTYSGGFRNFYSTVDIKKLSDFNEKKIRLLGGRMSRDLVDHLGLTMIDIAPHGSAWVDALKSNKLELDEAELIRLETYSKTYPELMKSIKVVVETNHSLYLTLVTISGRALKKLTREQQAILRDEAQRLAIAERELSIKQEKVAKANFEKMGIKFINLSKEDQKLLEIAAEKTNAMYKDSLSKWYELIKADIKNPVIAKD